VDLRVRGLVLMPTQQSRLRLREDAARGRRLLLQPQQALMSQREALAQPDAAHCWLMNTQLRVG
jgi:hypothetical protein